MKKLCNVFLKISFSILWDIIRFYTKVGNYINILKYAPTYVFEQALKRLTFLLFGGQIKEGFNFYSFVLYCELIQRIE